jgi:hypothetical protein
MDLIKIFTSVFPFAEFVLISHENKMNLFIIGVLEAVNVNTVFWDNKAVYEVYREVPGLGQKRNFGSTYSILAVISFKMVSLRTYTAIPLFFSTLQKHRGSNFP